MNGIKGIELLEKILEIDRRLVARDEKMQIDLININKWPNLVSCRELLLFVY